MENHVCSIFSQLSILEPLILAAYRSLLAFSWSGGAVIGMFIPIALAREGARSSFRLLVIMVIWLNLFVFMSGQFLAECQYSSQAPGTAWLLISNFIAIGLGLLLAVLVTRLFGPTFERFIDWLTGRSRLRRDALSDIRTVDEEIPDPPKEFDPREYIEGDRQ